MICDCCDDECPICKEDFDESNPLAETEMFNEVNGEEDTLWELP